MSAFADWRRVRRLGRYMVRDRRRLILTMLLLLPVAFAGAIQPLLVGQAISVLRGEPSLAWLSAMAQSSAIQLIVGLMLLSVLTRLALQGIQLFNIQALGQRLTARIREDLFNQVLAFALGTTESMHGPGCHGSSAWAE